ncbi:hypothetical protein F5146DRAFT_1006374 [Armillaria mellea]|nr:hypothetical protein F5146DRAFT_1006374 [Armillaria mellea]
MSEIQVQHFMKGSQQYNPGKEGEEVYATSGSSKPSNPLKTSLLKLPKEWCHQGNGGSFLGQEDHFNHGIHCLVQWITGIIQQFPPHYLAHFDHDLLLSTFSMEKDGVRVGENLWPLGPGWSGDDSVQNDQPFKGKKKPTSKLKAVADSCRCTCHKCKHPDSLNAAERPSSKKAKIDGTQPSRDVLQIFSQEALQQKLDKVQSDKVAETTAYFYWDSSDDFLCDLCKMTTSQEFSFGPIQKLLHHWAGSDYERLAALRSKIVYQQQVQLSKMVLWDYIDKILEVAWEDAWQDEDGCPEATLVDLSKVDLSTPEKEDDISSKLELIAVCKVESEEHGLLHQIAKVSGAPDQIVLSEVLTTVAARGKVEKLVLLFRLLYPMLDGSSLPHPPFNQTPKLRSAVCKFIHYVKEDTDMWSIFRDLATSWTWILGTQSDMAL